MSVEGKKNYKETKEEYPELDFKTTEEIKVPKRLIDQVIGQEKAKEIILQAAKQRRHVLLIGKPGTGKSMLAKALAELLPATDLEDFLCYPNPKDPYQPIIKTVPAGLGRKIVEEEFKRVLSKTLEEYGMKTRIIVFALILLILSNIFFTFFVKSTEKSDILIAADRISFTLFTLFFLFMFFLILAAPKVGPINPVLQAKKQAPKLLIDNSDKKQAPFVDATGAHEGALLGDVLHDPYQCLPKGQKILKNEGLFYVEDLIDPIFEKYSIEEGEIELKPEERFKIIGFNHNKNLIEETEVVKVYRRKYSGKLIKIVLKNSKRSVVATPEHPIAVWVKDINNPFIGLKEEKKESEFYRIDYKKAEDLKVGDYVVLVEIFNKKFYISLDEVEKIEEIEYDGFIYNFTTTTRNYVVDFILVHNSGGLETPPHLRVVPGLIHKAHKGVLFIDEIATLKPEMQIELLTAMQEKKYPITGRSPHSAGAMVQTTPAPCDFILVAAGTPETIKFIHPALRSRIRGYGYEVYMEDKMPDTPENRRKLAQFVAQEVVRDGKIPHFTKEAVIEIIKEARRMAGIKGYLTLQLRELGGLVRAAGDIARKKGHKYVTAEDVLEAKKLLEPIEVQMAKRILENEKKYGIVETKGAKVGKVNGLGVLTVENSPLGAGVVTTIYATVTPAAQKGKIEVYATGNLQKIAKEAVQNVFAIIKKYRGTQEEYDVHIQFFPVYPGGVEGDSASIAIATAIISALENIPVRQDVAMTGSLSVRGDVLPVGGINEKILAAKEAGMKYVIIPEKNKDDIFLSEKEIEGVEIIPVKNLVDVLKVALVDCEKKKEILEKIRKIIE